MTVKTVGWKRNLNTTADTDAQPSPRIFHDCPELAIREGTLRGTYIDEDWVNFPLIGTQTTEIAHGAWKVFNTGAGVVKSVSTMNSVEYNSLLEITLDTDNDSGAIAQSYPSFLLTGLTSNSGKLWFEARIAFSPITTNGLGWFVGLAETELWTLATGVPFNAGDAITNSASAIGFRKPEDDTTTWDTVYSDRATSFTAIGDADGTGAAAFEFIKLGIRYDPRETADCVTFYKNGLQLTNRLSRSALTALTNLDANALGVLIATIADSAGTSGKFYCDWLKVYQQLEDS